MASLFKGRRSTSMKTTAPNETITGAQTVTDDTVRPGCYLTDGVTLFRLLDTVASGLGEMVGLEDCRSLDVKWWTIRELRERRLRAVNPAGAK